MQRFIVGLGLLALATTSAQARSFDAKALARYDISYAKCESQYPEMSGHRDEAYLDLWRIKADPKNLAELDAVRQGKTYQSEKRRAMSAKSAAAPASAAFAQQCQGLWNEHKRVPKPKP
jgi:hypothetical protein